MQVSKQILVLCVSVSSCTLCFAQTQTIDSLKKILPSLHDTARIDCLNELGSEFSDRYWSKSKYQQTDTALFYTQQALNESQQLNYLKGIGRAYQNMGYIEEEHSNLNTAEDYTREALPILEKENMQAQYHRCRIFLGWILHNRGFFAQSIQIYKKELPYYEAIKDSEHIAAIYRITARAYDEQGNSENAFTYLQKDFAIQKKPDDAWGKRSTATLKASVYLAAGDTANAIFYYKQAGYFPTAYKLQKKYDSALLTLRKSITNIQSSKTDSLYKKVGLMINYNELIDLFLSLKKFDSAIIYSRAPLSFFKNGDHVTFLLPALKTVAAAYQAKKENSNTLFYTNQLLAYAQRSGARRFERDGYKLLWQIYADMHKANLADNYHLKYILLNDSLQSDKYISQATAWKAINDINIREANYQNQLKINDERSKAKIKFIDNKKKTQSYVFISAIALISLFTILIVRNSRLKRKKDQLQKEQLQHELELRAAESKRLEADFKVQTLELETQALRAQMNPHFIFNSLSAINMFILENNKLKASEYLTKFSKLIRLILQNSQEAFIPLEKELEALKLYLELESLRFENKFDYKIITEEDIDTTLLKVPPLIIQPYVENAIWHGLMHKNEPGYLHVELYLESEILFCKITDDGIGRRRAAELRSKSTLTHKSMGMRITADRMAILQEQNQKETFITINDLVLPDGSSGGTEVTLKIPVRYD